MRFVFSLLRLIFKLLLYAILLILLLMIGWTVLEIGTVYYQQQQSVSTMEARQPSYAATATALAHSDSKLRLERQPQTLLLQQTFATNTPHPTLPALASPEAPKEREPVDLPTLLMPPNPAPGLVLEGTAVPTRVPAIPRDYELVNIALLGGDGELGGNSFARTDTMIIVSLNIETGTVAMLSLPRDLFVYIPNGIMGRLNTAFGIGENIDWSPDGGFGLLRQTLFYNFGINIHYYASVNFSGFKSIIDHLGGVDIAVDCAYRDYYPVEDFDPEASSEENYEMRILDVGYYTFDGVDALWYARTRRYTDDFDRGRRQQQLLRGMWRKARTSGSLASLPALWAELTEIVDTNLPFDAMLGLLPHFINFDLGSLDNFTLKRTYHTTPWQTLDGDYVQLPQYEPIARLLRDFYTPPTLNQLALTGPSIAVYNGSGQANWDRVASERLRWDGYNAIALGGLDDNAVWDTSQLVDYVASDKGSIVPDISRALNMSPAQVQIQPNPDREYDYEVILGRDYDSCTFGVLPIHR